MKIISIDPLGTKGPHSLSLNVDQPVTALLLDKVHWIAKARGMPLSFSAEDGRLRLVEEGGVINAKTIEVVEKLLLEAEDAIASEAVGEQGVRAAMLYFAEMFGRYPAPLDEHLLQLAPALPVAAARIAFGFAALRRVRSALELIKGGGSSGKVSLANLDAGYRGTRLNLLMAMRALRQAQRLLRAFKGT